MVYFDQTVTYLLHLCVLYQNYYLPLALWGILTRLLTCHTEVEVEVHGILALLVVLLSQQSHIQ